MMPILPPRPLDEIEHLSKIKKDELRDQFAKEAMKALIPKYNPCNGCPEMIAEESYKIADAMIQERDKRK